MGRIKESERKRRNPRAENSLNKNQLECLRLMVETNMTKAEIAEHIGVNRSTVYDWLSKEYFTRKLNEYTDAILTGMKVESVNRIKELMRQEEDKRTAFQSAKFVAELSGLTPEKRVSVNTEEKIVITLDE